MSKAKSSEKAEKVLAPPSTAAGEEVLVDPSAKANFWKPKEVDETKVGKMLGKSNTTYGEVINLDTATGLVQIPISVVLKKVDWDKYNGKMLYFQYRGTVKRYRTFFVKVVTK